MATDEVAVALAGMAHEDTHMSTITTPTPEGVTLNRFDEAYHTVRGEMRYFALYATDHGVIEISITRSEDNTKKQDTYTSYRHQQLNGRDAGATDYKVDARLFNPGSAYPWTWIAGLIYGECEGKDVPMHGELRDHHLDLLRADSGKLAERAVALLAAHAQTAQVLAVT